MKRLFLSSTLALAMTTLSAVGHAACPKTGNIERVTMNSLNTVIFVRTSALSPDVYMYLSTDNKLLGAALHALESRALVIVTTPPAEVCRLLAVEGGDGPFAAMDSITVTP